MSSTIESLSRKDFLRATSVLLGSIVTQVSGNAEPWIQAQEQTKVGKFAERILSDTAVAMLSFGAYIGDRLGIYKAMLDTGPATVSMLAAKTHLNERYLQEWLALMATAGYVDYESYSSKYSLPREHAQVLCDENSPFFMAGFIESLACVFATTKVIEGFRGGKGPLSEDYPPEHWEGIERSTAPSYRNFLTQSYLPAMPEVVARLRAGGTALDLGCGAGLAAIAIAKAYPKAEVFGFDVFAPSIEKAKNNAQAADLGQRIHFETYDGITLPADRFDLITACYTVHHLTDPEKVLSAVRRALKKGASLLVIEAKVPEKIEESIGHTWANWNYGVSLFYCMSAVVAEGGPAYGAAIKGSEVKMLGEKAGFKSFRRLAADNAFDALYEFKAD